MIDFVKSLDGNYCAVCDKGDRQIGIVRMPGYVEGKDRGRLKMLCSPTPRLMVDAEYVTFEWFVYHRCPGHNHVAIRVVEGDPLRLDAFYPEESYIERRRG